MWIRKIIFHETENQKYLYFCKRMTLVINTIKNKFPQFKEIAFLDSLPEIISKVFLKEIVVKTTTEIDYITKLILVFYTRGGENRTLADLAADINNWENNKNAFNPCVLFFKLSEAELYILTINKDYRDLLAVYTMAKQKITERKNVSIDSVLSDIVYERIATNFQYVIEHYFDKIRDFGPNKEVVVLNKDTFYIKRLPGEGFEVVKTDAKSKWTRHFAHVDHITPETFPETEARRAVRNKIQLMIPEYICTLFTYLKSNIKSDFFGKTLNHLISKIFFLMLFRSEIYKNHFPGAIEVLEYEQEADKQTVTRILANLYNIISALIKSNDDDNLYVPGYYNEDNIFITGKPINYDKLVIDIKHNYLHRKIEQLLENIGALDRNSINKKMVLKIDIPHTDIIFQGRAHAFFAERVFPVQGIHISPENITLKYISENVLKSGKNGRPLHYRVKIVGSNGSLWEGQVVSGDDEKFKNILNKFSRKNPGANIFLNAERII